LIILKSQPIQLLQINIILSINSAKSILYLPIWSRSFTSALPHRQKQITHNVLSNWRFIFTPNPSLLRSRTIDIFTVASIFTTTRMLLDEEEGHQPLHLGIRRWFSLVRKRLLRTNSETYMVMSILVSPWCQFCVCCMSLHFYKSLSFMPFYLAIYILWFDTLPNKNKHLYLSIFFSVPILWIYVSQQSILQFNKLVKLVDAY
jgi:hypothetical protein